MTSLPPITPRRTPAQRLSQCGGSLEDRFDAFVVWQRSPVAAHFAESHPVEEGDESSVTTSTPTSTTEAFDSDSEDLSAHSSILRVLTQATIRPSKIPTPTSTPTQGFRPANDISMDQTETNECEGELQPPRRPWLSRIPTPKFGRKAKNGSNRIVSEPITTTVKKEVSTQLHLFQILLLTICRTSIQKSILFFALYLRPASIIVQMRSLPLLCQRFALFRLYRP